MKLFNIYIYIYIYIFGIEAFKILKGLPKLQEARVRKRGMVSNEGTDKWR